MRLTEFVDAKDFAKVTPDLESLVKQLDMLSSRRYRWPGAVAASQRCRCAGSRRRSAVPRTFRRWFPFIERVFADTAYAGERVDTLHSLWRYLGRRDPTGSWNGRSPVVVERQDSGLSFLDYGQFGRLSGEVPRNAPAGVLQTQEEADHVVDACWPGRVRFGACRNAGMCRYHRRAGRAEKSDHGRDQEARSACLRDRHRHSGLRVPGFERRMAGAGRGMLPRHRRCPAGLTDQGEVHRHHLQGAVLGPAVGRDRRVDPQFRADLRAQHAAWPGSADVQLLHRADVHGAQEPECRARPRI